MGILELAKRAITRYADMDASPESPTGADAPDPIKSETSETGAQSSTDFPPPHPSIWRTRLPGPDGEPCPDCGLPLTGSTCWPEMKRVCADCAVLFDGVMNRFCPRCRLKG